jgi:hypothetical protein
MKKISILVFAMVAFFSLNAQHTVTLNVDMRPAIDSGLFNPADTTNAVFIAGDFWNGVNQWNQPGSNLDFQMTDADGDTIYSITLDTVADNIAFKFFLVFDGNASWDNGEWPGDPNREATISSDTSLTFQWGILQTAGIRSIENLNITIFPVPASQFITINSEGFAQIYNTNGKLVISQNLSDSKTINVANLTPGVYFVKVKNAQGVATQKIIIK